MNIKIEKENDIKQVKISFKDTPITNFSKKTFVVIHRKEDKDVLYHQGWKLYFEHQN